MKSLIRSLQTNFPYLLEAKFLIQRFYRRTLRIPFERDFALLGMITLPSEALLIDVGANRGQSIDALRLYSADSPICSFEPNQILFNKLKKLFKNDENTTILPYGLGKQNTILNLFVPIYKGFQFDGLASLIKEEAMSWLNERTIVGFNPRHLSCITFEVEIRKLDEFELNPFFMKLDVQGSELDVLIGAENTIRRHAPILLIETPELDREIKFLESYDYMYYRFDGKYLWPQQRGALNSAFVPRSKLQLVKHLLA